MDESEDKVVDTHDDTLRGAGKIMPRQPSSNEDGRWCTDPAAAGDGF